MNNIQRLIYPSTVNWVFMLVLSILFLAIGVTTTICININKSNKNILGKDKAYKIGIGLGSIFTFFLAILNSAIGGIYQKKLLNLYAENTYEASSYANTLSENIKSLNYKFDIIGRIFSPIFQFVFALMIFLVLVKFCIEFSKKNDKKSILNLILSIGFISSVAISKLMSILSIFAKGKILFGLIETILTFGYLILLLFVILNLVDLCKNYKNDKSLRMWKTFFIITVVVIGLFVIFQFMKVLPVLYNVEMEIKFATKGKPIENIYKNQDSINLLTNIGYVIGLKNKYLYTIGFVYMIFINFAPRTLKIEQNKKVLEDDDKVIDFFEK